MDSLHGAYWEGVIQVRPKDKKVVDFIRSQIKKRNDAKISKELFFKYGADIYITSHKVARDIGRRLKGAFQGDLVITKKIYGYDNLKSKSIYRATVLFRVKPKGE